MFLAFLYNVQLTNNNNNKSWHSFIHKQYELNKRIIQEMRFSNIFFFFFAFQILKQRIFFLLG